MKKLTCHCKEVEAQINIDNLEKLIRCNCSICKRKGAIMSMVKNDDFKIIKGQNLFFSGPVLELFLSKTILHF